MKDCISELDDALSRLGRHFASMKPRYRHTQVSDSHMVLLRRLVVSDGLRMSEIAKLLAVKPPAVSAIVDYLVNTKVVERVPDPTDRRVTIIRLTPFGLKTWTEVDERRRQDMSKCLSVLDADDKKDLLRICNKLLASMEHPTTEETQQ